LGGAPSASAQEYPAGGKIPLLISDHHADHAFWLLNHIGLNSAAALVLDAHADTETHPEWSHIREAAGWGHYETADYLVKNHNWIHPLTPSPVSSLVWISRIAGFPGGERLAGFLRSTASWDITEIACISLEELDTIPRGDGPLFVSVDLDFFYNEDYTPADIPFVFDRLLDYSLGRKGDVYWALCLSYAWLPNAEYAWELLRQSLTWIAGRTEFAAPETTLFTVDRYDTSRKAAAYRAEGTEPPALYRQEALMPDDVRALFRRLADGKKTNH
jgi:hypothetical protein